MTAIFGWRRPLGRAFVLASLIWGWPTNAAEVQLRGLQVAQLDIQIGGGKFGLGGGGCQPDDPACQEMQRRNKMGHRSSGDGSEPGMGLGIEIGIPSDQPPSYRRLKKASDGHKPKPQPKEKIARQPPKPAPVAPQKPVEPVAYLPPTFPIATHHDCGDCDYLWEAILKYQKQLNEDSRKIYDRNHEILDRLAEIENMKGKLRGANAIDTTYYKANIDIDTNYIEGMKQDIAELQKIIDQEWSILRDRMALYEDCVKRQCVPPVVVNQPEAPGEGLAPPTVSKPPVVPPVAVTPEPQPKPMAPPVIPADAKICGPDITPSVIKVLRKIKKEFETKQPGQTDDEKATEQKGKCRALIDLRTGGYAWDINQLSPSTSLPRSHDDEPPYNYDKDSDSWIQKDKDGTSNSMKPWFTGTSPNCAIPRNIPACATTVEFMGICEHAQVVNYLQWNFMLGLCGGIYPYLGTGLRAAWNYKTYGNAAPNAAQANIGKISSKIFEKMSADENDDNFSDIAADLQRLDKQLDSPIKECKLECGITIDDDFSYRWITSDADVSAIVREYRKKLPW